MSGSFTRRSTSTNEIDRKAMCFCQGSAPSIIRCECPYAVKVCSVEDRPPLRERIEYEASVRGGEVLVDRSGRRDATEWEIF
ncbi:hypothetical protein CEXT_403451 [Caerostris extrusa]|uniref:Uncharacterized protein n=1 Tax=Caerostris extrusa TaxID=172846 RepID=A0AAV4V2N0_CAEEX|nr:hypothetical protein CEXT_403451 [Caerostris extrusa]